MVWVAEVDWQIASVGRIFAAPVFGALLAVSRTLPRFAELHAHVTNNMTIPMILVELPPPATNLVCKRELM